MEASNKQKKLYVELQQRHNNTEQNYAELSNKCQELQSSRQALLSDSYALQSSIDAERNARLIESSRAQELAGETLFYSERITMVCLVEIRRSWKSYSLEINCTVWENILKL